MSFNSIFIKVRFVSKVWAWNGHFQTWEKVETSCFEFRQAIQTVTQQVGGTKILSEQVPAWTRNRVYLTAPRLVDF